jgi:hypothetical protein
MTDADPGTALAERPRSGFDLTHAPWRQWDKQMVDLCKATVFPQAQDEATVYFCLAVADSLGLNPFAGEVYFIPSKARDGNPAGAKPYIGREGLVKKASERDYYFEGDVVCKEDKFRIASQPRRHALVHPLLHPRRGEARRDRRRLRLPALEGPEHQARVLLREDVGIHAEPDERQAGEVAVGQSDLGDDPEVRDDRRGPPAVEPLGRPDRRRGRPLHAAGQRRRSRRRSCGGGRLRLRADRRREGARAPA